MVKERKDEPKDDKKPKKESDLKKFLNKRSFIYLSAAVFFVVFIVPDMIAPSDLENKLTLNFPEGQGPYYTAWDIVKSYKGGDISPDGYTLLETLITQLEKMYPNEQILKHNDTVLEVSASGIPDDLWLGDRSTSLSYPKTSVPGSPQNIYGYYMVTFTFQTYDDHREYVWMVDMKDQFLVALNDDTQKMMDIVELYD